MVKKKKKKKKPTPKGRTELILNRLFKCKNIYKGAKGKNFKYVRW